VQDDPDGIDFAALRPCSLASRVFPCRYRDANRVKMLYWDGTGLWILEKRLERGRFCRPKSCSTDVSKIVPIDEPLSPPIIEPAKPTMIG